MPEQRQNFLRVRWHQEARQSSIISGVLGLLSAWSLADGCAALMAALVAVNRYRTTYEGRDIPI